MRLYLSGSFGEDLNREAMLLVPLCLSENELEKISGMWLTEQEKELNLPLYESCTSSSWWAGSRSDEEDHLITDEYDFLISVALAAPDVQNRMQEEINKLYEKQKELEEILVAEYQDGETDYAAQLEIQIENLENVISDYEEMLCNSRFFSIGNMVRYYGYPCEVSDLRDSFLFLNVYNSDKQFHVSVKDYFHSEPSLEKPALDVQILSAESKNNTQEQSVSDKNSNLER